MFGASSTEDEFILLQVLMRELKYSGTDKGQKAYFNSLLRYWKALSNHAEDCHQSQQFPKWGTQISESTLRFFPRGKWVCIAFKESFHKSTTSMCPFP